MKSKSFNIILMIFCLFFNLNARDIDAIIPVFGDNSTCTEEVYSYSVTNDPSVFYEWTITGGTIISAPTGSNTVSVAWYSGGTISVSAYSDPAMTIQVDNGSLAVAVDLLDPYITLDPEVGCLDEKGKEDQGGDERNENDCRKACLDNKIKYYSNGNAGSMFNWVIIGDATVYVNTSSVLEVEWNSVGFGVVKLIEMSVNGCTAETEICVEVIDKPMALFNVIPGLTVCIDQEVIFEDLATAIGNSDLTAWEWSVTDGSFQAYTESHDFTHTFNSGGSYGVELKVYNDCGCYDVYKVEINVIDEEGPDIHCPKAVCPKEKTVLYTNDSCGDYFWAVDNGTIIDGHGTNKITVMWDDVPAGVGLVQLATPCGECNIPTVLEIPIVGSSLDIDGPIEACRGDQVTLTAPEIPGTFYTWNVYSSPLSAVVVQEIHNQVIIEVTGTAPITVEVVYNSEIAGCGDGCGGSSTHTLIATEPSFVSGNTAVCVGASPEVYNIVGPAAGNITIDKPDGSIDVISDGGSYVFMLDGVYVFTPNNTGCQGPPLVVNAFAIPDVPDFINGEQLVCQGIPYIYEAGNDIDGTIYSWTATNGTPATGVGKEIAVTWNAGGGWSLDVQRINIQTPNCASPSISIPVNQISVSPILTGDAIVCANKVYPYSLDYLDGEEYKWEIIAEGQGSVISDPNSSAVNIQWNNTSGTADVIASVRKCNVWYSVTMNVVIEPVSNVNFSASSNLICEGQSVSFTADPGYTYTWNISPSMGGTIGNVSTFSRTFTSAGTFTVTLVAEDNCGNISNHFELITVNPAPPAQLGISNNTMSCNSSGVVTSGSATLVTTIIGGVSGHSFAWTFGGMPFGGNTPTITVSNIGTYVVVVTDTATGCTATENVTISCPTGQGCTMPATNTGTLTFAYDNTNCGEVSFTGTASTTAGWSITTESISHAGVNNFYSPSSSYIYDSFDAAGYYEVSYEICYANGSTECCTVIDRIVPIPVVADAEASAFCDGTGTYMIQLDDFSSTVSDLASYNVTWTVGGTTVNMPGVTSGTTTIPLGGLVPGGTYPVTLQVDVPMGAVAGMPSAYQCEIATTVVIPALPNANFVNDAPVCEDLGVSFIAGPNSINTNYAWSFGDGATLLQTGPNASRKYDGPMAGGYNVNLIVTNAAGCTDASTAVVNVESNEFVNSGINVSPTLPICTPNPATLTFTHTGSASAISYDWSNGATIDPNVVFTAGGYLVTATDIFGCATTTNLMPVDIRPSPSAIIFGATSYCINTDIPVELYGFAGQGLTYQWNKRPSGGSWSPLSTSSDVSDSGVTVSNSPYEYELVVTDPATGCSSSSIKTIIINPAPPAPAVAQVITNCDPLSIDLTATTGVSPADFNWSNGQSGASISVLHGGLYEVTLTDGNGCINTRELDVVGEPNLDFFPVGCYEYCERDLPLMYPGPYGAFDYWELLLNGSTIQAGSGPVTNLVIVTDGDYTLEVKIGPCLWTTGVMSVKLNREKCEENCEKKCDVKIGKIYPEQIQDCLYEFTVDVYTGECTDIVDYIWRIDGVIVPGGAVLSYVFDTPGVSHEICVEVIGEDQFGNQCSNKTCLDFKPTCECDCDIEADFTYEQEKCDFHFIDNSTSSRCTEIYKHIWTFSSDGEVFFEDSGEEIGYHFESLYPVEVCLTVIGQSADEECSDTYCMTIFPCNQNTEGRSSEDSATSIPTMVMSPNPVTDDLRFQCNGVVGKKWQIKVTDLGGRLISNNEVDVEGGYLIMSTKGWNDGMYQVIIFDELGNRFIEKIVKMN